MSNRTTRNADKNTTVIRIPTEESVDAKRIRSIAGAVAHSFRANVPSVAVYAKGVVAVNTAMSVFTLARTFLKADNREFVIVGNRHIEADKPVDPESFIFYLHEATQDVDEDSVEHLKVSSKSESFKVTGAICHRIRSGSAVSISCIGRFAIYNTMTAFIQARRFLKKENIFIGFQAIRSYIDIDEDNKKIGCTITIAAGPTPPIPAARA